MRKFEYPEGIPPSDELILYSGEEATDAGGIVASYEEPNNELWFGERYEEDMKIIAYTDLAQIAFVDVVKVKRVDNHEVLGPLLLRIDGEVQEVAHMLNHPSLYASKDKALEVFEKAA